MDIKRGNTFGFYINCKDKDGKPVEYSEIACQIKTRSGLLVESLTVTPTETTGRYLALSAGTALYPLGKLVSDILVDGSINSASFAINVSEPVTEDE